MVEDVKSRGAQATPDEEKQRVRYLTVNFGIGSFQSSAPESAAPEESPVPAQTQAAPVLDASQKARAKELIRSGGCLSCHRIDGEGSYAGPHLGDVGKNHITEQIRFSLVYPNKELAPQNRSVRLITQEGKTLVGKLLNQDGFSVQLIDASGHLMTFESANLRNFTIITANSTPSYSDRISPQGLSLLINSIWKLRRVPASSNEGSRVLTLYFPEAEGSNRHYEGDSILVSRAVCGPHMIS